MSNATVCGVCSVGSFSGSHASVCSKCQAGFFSNASNTSTYSQCQAGSFSASNSTNCVQCQVGNYNGVGAGAYLPCPVGLFSNVSQPCRQLHACHMPGRVLPVTHLSVAVWSMLCRDLPTLPAQSVCVQCDAGTYASSTGQSQCQQCAGCGANTVVLASC